MTSPATSQFAAALFATGLDSFLEEHDSVTVFAPSNEAFLALSQSEHAALMTDFDRLDQLTRALIVPQPILGDELFSGAGYTTEAGTVLKVDPAAQTVEGGHLVVADIVASNGVVHIIDVVPST